MNNIKAKFILFFCLNLFATLFGLCHAQSKADDLNDGAYCSVLYWPNKNMGFGHVALEAYEGGKGKCSPDIYLSWAMGNSFRTDMYKHEMDPERIILPKMPKENFEKFKKWFEKSEFSFNWQNYNKYGDSYSLLNKNCAHAVAKGLREFGYDVKLGFSFGLRPSQIKKMAKKILESKK